MSGGGNGIFLVKFLKKIQAALSTLLDYCKRKLTVPETGRLPVTRSTMRTFGIAFLVIVALAVILNNTFNNYLRKKDLGDYKKEVVVDPSVALPQLDDAALDRSVHYNDMYTTTQGVDLSAEGSASEMLTKEDCLVLVQRLKDGNSPFSLDEEQKLKTCVESNIAELSEKDLALAKALVDENLSEEQKTALREKWNTGKAKTNDKVAKQLMNAIDKGGEISKGLAAKGLSLGAGKVVDLVRELQKSNEAKDKALAAKLAENRKLTPQEIEDLKKALEASGLQVVNGRDGDSGLSGDSGEAGDLRLLSEKIKEQQEALSEAKKEAAEAQAAARDAVKKIMNGTLITPEEQEQINRLNEANQRAAKAEALLKENMLAAKELAESLKKNLDSFNEITTDVYSFTGQGSYKLQGKGGKGRPKAAAPKMLTLKEVEAIKLREISDQLLGGVEIESRILNNVADGQGIDAKKLIVAADVKDRITLDSKAKIPAVLVSELMYASGGPNQQVRVKVLSNIYDVETNRIAIPKDQILIAQASNFSEETGIMDLRFSKVRVGKKTYEVSISVGSADGTMGLKGDVYSRTGQKLVAALITSFSAGVLNWFSADISNRYGQSRNFGQAATGAVMGGAAEVGDKIATQMASNLNNIPAVFYAPVGTNIILFPEE